MKQITINFFFGAILLSGFSASSWSQDLTVMSRKLEIGKTLVKEHKDTKSSVRDQFYFVKSEGHEFAFERVLVDGDNPDWHVVAMRTAARFAGKSPVRLGDLDPAEQSAIRRLLMNGPVRGAFLHNAMKSPDFKVGFAAVVKSDFAAGGRTVSTHVELKSVGFTENLFSSNLSFPTPSEREKNASLLNEESANEAIEKADHLFVRTALTDEQYKVTLKQKAFEILNELRKQRTKLAEEMYRMQITRALGALQDQSDKWDGQASIDAANLDPALSKLLETNFSEQAGNLGFSDKQSAIDFLRSAKLSNCRPSLMMYFSGQAAHGKHTVGFGLGGINP